MSLTVTTLLTARTVSRILGVADAPLLLRYRTENRGHLEPWEPLHNEAYYTLAHCQRTLASMQQAMALDQAYPFAILNLEGSLMMGSMTFANLVQGVFQACHLGYGIGAVWQGRGLMHEALESGLEWAFGTLGLHRIMANYLPHNQRSARLLERLGFEREGYPKRYLKIAGRWQDHMLAARYRLDD